MIIYSEDIINYWFSDRIKPQWFCSTAELDREILEKHEALWVKAATGGLDGWSNNPIGCLALVIILDQFPLNMFRNQAKSFSTEKVVLKISKSAIQMKFDKELNNEELSFLYMPFMHSENINDQNMSVKLYKQTKLPESIKFAEHHRDIVNTYGRFPHRNKILSRESTKQELAYLASDSAFLG